jgi:hypothetical protein
MLIITTLSFTGPASEPRVGVALGPTGAAAVGNSGGVLRFDQHLMKTQRAPARAKA